ncbi:hypothetical protein L1887_53225 [Cichorium endivia]|nr:hypothetical protein L1887_53225 [Cichorium endivia]
MWMRRRTRASFWSLRPRWPYLRAVDARLSRTYAGFWLRREALIQEADLSRDHGQDRRVVVCCRARSNERRWGGSALARYEWMQGMKSGWMQESNVMVPLEPSLELCKFRRAAQPTRKKRDSNVTSNRRRPHPRPVGCPPCKDDPSNASAGQGPWAACCLLSTTDCGLGDRVAREGASDRAGVVRVADRDGTRPDTRHADDGRDGDHEHGDDEADDLAPRLDPAALVEVEPHDGAEAGEERPEERRLEAEERREERDELGEDEGEHPGERVDERPHDPAELGRVVDVLRARAEDDDVQMLVRHLSALAAGDEDGGQRQAVRDAAHGVREAVETGRGGVLAEVVVDHTAHDEVEHQLDADEHKQTLAEVGRLAHLRDDGQVARDRTKADKQVEHVEESGEEVDLDARCRTECDHLDGRCTHGSVLRARHAAGDHGKDDDDDDGAERDKGRDGEELVRARQREEERDDGKDGGERDGARVPAEHVERLCAEQHVVALQEDGEDELRGAEEARAPGPEHEEAGVLQVLDAGEAHLELPVLVAGVPADVGEEEGEQHERHHPERDGDKRDAEDAERDGVGDLIEEGALPAERLGDGAVIVCVLLRLLHLGNLLNVAHLHILALFRGLVHLCATLAEQLEEVAVLPRLCALARGEEERRADGPRRRLGLAFGRGRGASVGVACDGAGGGDAVVAQTSRGFERCEVVVAVRCVALRCSDSSLVMRRTGASCECCDEQSRKGSEVKTLSEINPAEVAGVSKQRRMSRCRSREGAGRIEEADLSLMMRSDGVIWSRRYRRANLNRDAW